jgi:hypothetical protein
LGQLSVALLLLPTAVTAAFLLPLGTAAAAAAAAAATVRASAAAFAARCAAASAVAAAAVRLLLLVVMALQHSDSLVETWRLLVLVVGLCAQCSSARGIWP